MCYVLLVIQLLSMNGFFPLYYEFFPVCNGRRPCSNLMIRGVTVSCRLPVHQQIFSCLLWIFFPVIHSRACVHQSCIFKVADVICAVSYTVAKYEWIFLSIVYFPVCVFPCSIV